MSDKPRITLELRQDQLNDLRYYLDWGIRSKVFEAVFDDLIEMLKKDRVAVVNLLLTRHMKLQDFLKEPQDG